MPATPQRIGFVLAETRSVTSGPDAAVVARYGDLARDTRAEPVESFFDDPADAQVLLDERHALLKIDRRRFRQEVIGAGTGLALAVSPGTPAAQVIDEERSADHAAAIVEITVALGDDRTVLTTWG